ASPFGHLGLFPEQAVCWDWIAERVRVAGRPLMVLNLFAYTGGSTLATAQAGGSVVHVDAARNMVTRARENARASQLEDAPIRWICDDVLRFVRREVRRGNQYDGIIVDPPAYGHGPKGEPWKLDKHLPDLLEICGCLMQRHPQFLLLTCHATQYGAKRSSPDRRGGAPPRSANDRPRSGSITGWTNVRPDKATGRRLAENRVTEAGLANASKALRQRMADAVPSIELPDVELGPLTIESTTGRRLSCGVFARWKQP
ncbi:MAG: class I SAM-dependent methyltransferase, partial [Pirellulales bacterium]